MDFSTKIIAWYKINKRNLPWRNTVDPYYIWISEVILQQTRVDQGLSYYKKFIHHFPTIQDLANANEEKVMKLWQGLGYYNRAKNMHHTAKHITHELNGMFPTTYKEIIKLNHKAFDRALYSEGALSAASWLIKKKPGLYSMRNVLNFK